MLLLCGRIDDRRIGVAEDRDGLGRTCSVSATARDTVLEKTKRIDPQERRCPSPRSRAPFFSALAVLFLQPGTLFAVPQNLTEKSPAPPGPLN